MSKSIKLKDDTYIDSTGIVHNRDLLSTILNNINKRLETNIMVISLSANTNVNISQTWTYYKVPLNTENIKLGDKLTFSNNGIKIGSGINTIRISANLMALGTTGYIVGGIKNNNDIISQGYIRPANNQHYISMSLSPRVIQVNENDIITLVCESNTTGSLTIANGAYTYLNVEVID